MEPSWANAARRLTPLLPGALCLLALAGCRSGDQQVQTELFQRELRLQEDEIYRLEDYIEEYQSIIRGYRCEVAELKEELAEARQTAAEPPAPLPEPLPLDGAGRLRQGGGSILSPSIDTPPIETPPEEPELPLDPDELIETPDASPAPEFDAPTPATPPPGDEAPPFQSGLGADASDADHAAVVVATSESDQPDGPARRQAHDAPARFSPPNPFPHAADATPLPAPTDEPKTLAKAEAAEPPIALSVESLDEGQAVVVVSEQRVAALAGFTGEASVLLVDPSAAGRPTKLARWDYTPQEVDAARALLDGVAGLRIELPLLLPADLPTGQPLRVWVRLVDRSGDRRLAWIDVALVGRPPRLIEAAETVATQEPRRLPAPGGLDWRPAADSAVRPAAFESPSESRGARDAVPK